MVRDMSFIVIYTKLYMIIYFAHGGSEKSATSNTWTRLTGACRKPGELRSLTGMVLSDVPESKVLEVVSDPFQMENWDHEGEIWDTYEIPLSGSTARFGTRDVAVTWDRLVFYDDCKTVRCSTHKIWDVGATARIQLQPCSIPIFQISIFRTNSGSIKKQTLV